MSTRPIRRMTLSQLTKEAEHVVRDLTEHFSNGYAPVLEEMAQVLRGNPKDATIVHAAQQVREQHRYARELIERLDEILQAIQEQIERTGGP